jgi:2,3-bisphosphoglycerate-independent phosphoglycerate mutase
MKYALIIPDGCADFPIESLGGKTPLQAARLPAMDAIAREGLVGVSDNTPAHLPAGSEVANLALLGYDPNRYFTGRAPIEAAARGIQLGPDDWAIRCNTVTIEDQVMVDFTAGHVSTDESKQLLESMQHAVESSLWEFVPGVSYRNLLIYRGIPGSVSPFSSDTKTRAPHDLTDLSVADEYPRGPGCDSLSDLMQRSAELFPDHPVNIQRLARGLRPVTHLWLWGLGKTPSLETFDQRFGVRGAMITAVDLLRGLAALVGWDRVEVPGATGYLDTDYAAKGRWAVDALERYDMVCVHIEAPDEASHEGRVEEKIKALESIDQHIVAPIHQALRQYGDYRILVTPDHPTPVSTKKHSHGWVPFAACGQGIAKQGCSSYDESVAGTSKYRFANGWELMPRFLSRSDF